MKEKNNKLLKIIGIESLLMISAIFVSCLAAMIQLIGRKYIGYHSFLFSGTDYQYNIFLYIAGIVIYFLYLILIYKKVLKKYINILSEYKIGIKILVWFVCGVFSFIMFVAIFMVLFLILGLSDVMHPECLSLVTIIGWPVMTALLFGVVLIRNRKRTV